MTEPEPERVGIITITISVSADLRWWNTWEEFERDRRLRPRDRIPQWLPSLVKEDVKKALAESEDILPHSQFDIMSVEWDHW